MKRHGLDYWDGALAGMIVCGVLFRYYCKEHKKIDPLVAAGIVSVGIVSGAKTAPPPLGPGEGSETTGTVPAPTANRLLLGERNAVMVESQTNGGLYIDLNPEVLRLLDQGNIDPLLIYVRALEVHVTEKKIPRIDFVKADVNLLFDEWEGKDLSQAPIHVQLAFWLKSKASSYGYVQNGNSWILKM